MAAHRAPAPAPPRPAPAAGLKGAVAIWAPSLSRPIVAAAVGARVLQNSLSQQPAAAPVTRVAHRTPAPPHRRASRPATVVPRPARARASRRAPPANQAVADGG